MDATHIALIGTAIVSISTVIAALISTVGHMRALRESEAKERLRDDVDRLRSENDWLRKSLAYSLRQAGAYHELEDIYFKQCNPGKHERLKSEKRKLAEEACGIYPRSNRKQCFSQAEQVESGQSFISIQTLASLTETESST